MKRIVVLLSGRGSNMEAIVQACRDEGWPAVIAAVIADRPQAVGLERAVALGLSTRVVDHRGFADRSAFERALADAIDDCQADLVVLAGFMRILGEAFIERYAGRLLNIHPSLLPAFPGLATHRRALQEGVAAHGATVHLVDTGLDAGPIVAQAVVPVLGSDTEASLAGRVLRAEHRLYPMALRWFVEERVRVEGRRVELIEARDGEARLLVEAGVDADASAGGKAGT
ncbi:MAG: phosphoribosylglycinamide formyltransferase [Burkholderiales bacterium]|nr:phosphoribosylglycinamide formyltransferase [Burkholderiales bacterium]